MTNYDIQERMNDLNIEDLMRDEELSDQFFYSSEIEDDLLIGPINENSIQAAAEQFKKNNPGHPWTVEKLVRDFIRRITRA